MAGLAEVAGQGMTCGKPSTSSRSFFTPTSTTESRRSGTGRRRFYRAAALTKLHPHFRHFLPRGAHALKGYVGSAVNSTTDAETPGTLSR